MSGGFPGARTVRSLLHPGAHLNAFREALAFLRANRRIVMAMAMRDIGNRYAGQVLGVFWAVGHPLFQMAVLVFVFGVVFFQRIGGTYEMPRDYTVYILTGLSAWLSLSPVLATACGAVTGNVNLIKQFTFDARILPAKELVIGSVVWLASLSILIVYSFLTTFSVPWTYVLLPVLAAIHLLTAMGCAWALAGLSVFLRDTKDVVTLANTVMIYILPVIYLPSWVPPLFRPIIFINPFSYLIWVYQDVFYFGRIEHPWSWPLSMAIAVAMFTAGYRLFRRLQPMFGSAM